MTENVADMRLSWNWINLKMATKMQLKLVLYHIFDHIKPTLKKALLAFKSHCIIFNQWYILIQRAPQFLLIIGPQKSIRNFWKKPPAQASFYRGLSDIAKFAIDRKKLRNLLFPR